MPKSNTLNETDKTELKRLYAEGMSMLQLSHRFLVSPNTIRYHLGKRTTKATVRR
jgi:DNA-binding CsgD family transcriptional regulator